MTALSSSLIDRVAHALDDTPGEFARWLWEVSIPHNWDAAWASKRIRARQEKAKRAIAAMGAA